MKLIPMTDFVLEKTNEITNEYLEDDQIKILNAISDYAIFLKQPITLGMFVPCDDDGNILEDPYKNGLHFRNYLKTYDKAKSKVLFNGFYIESLTVRNILGDCIIYYKGKNKMSDLNIEDLIDSEIDLTVSF